MAVPSTHQTPQSAPGLQDQDGEGVESAEPEATSVPITTGFSDAPPTGFSDTAPTGFSDAAAPSAGGSQEGLQGSGTSSQKVGYIDIPQLMVGKLIGKGGETIKALQYQTGTKIQIDHLTPGDHKKVSITSSSLDAIEDAKKQVHDIISSEDAPRIGEVHRSVDCPPGIVGRVIGRGGETIRSLQQASQANIVVDQNFPEGVPRKVNVSGRPDAVDRAVKMISELINGEPGSAQAIIQKVSPQHQGNCCQS